MTKELVSGFDISKIVIEREELNELHPLLRSIMATKSLKELSLQINSIGDTGAKYIGEGLGESKTLLELNLCTSSLFELI